MKWLQTIKNKKVQNSKARSNYKIMEKLSGILRYKHKDVLLLLKIVLGKKPHCWQRNISSEMLLHWVSSNFFFLDDI